MQRLVTVILFSLFTFSSLAADTKLRVAVFNVSMEATNYIAKGEKASAAVLATELASGANMQIKNIAEIIQRAKPDIILLNEFDLLDEKSGVEAFKNNYLSVSQQGQTAIDYAYHYVGSVNTGMPSPFDLNNDGKKSGYGNDAYGYGLYEGQYGMVLLSKYPIEIDAVRSLQYFKWRDMPNAQVPVSPDTNQAWYHAAEWADFRLSSKSHWDIPVDVCLLYPSPSPRDA